LEWQTDSPPPTTNFDETPVVTEEAYNYDPEADAAESQAHHDTTRDAGQEDL
jgi:cytochrome c oxidase subunit 1